MHENNIICSRQRLCGGGTITFFPEYAWMLVMNYSAEKKGSDEKKASIVIRNSDYSVSGVKETHSTIT